MNRSFVLCRSIFASLFPAVAVFFFSCSASRRLPVVTELPASSIHPYGRYVLDKNNNIELVGTAVHFGFSFEGKQAGVVASLNGKQDHNYIQYELDGVYQKKVIISGDSSQVITIMAPVKGKHTVWIYKTTEALSGPVIIEKITGNNVQPLPDPDYPLIEFIGNSITSGADADYSEIPCGTGAYYDHHNGYFAYGPRVCRALKCNYIVSSVSGIGVYRNWNADGPVMPQVYEKTEFQEDSSSIWNFSRYSPRIVSIALGTNDFSKGDGIKKRLPFSRTSFVESYISFIKLVKSKYPNATIALLGSPMIDGENRIIMQNCLNSIKKSIDDENPSDKPVALFFFDPMKTNGCGGHPDVQDHEIIADELIPFYQDLLK